MSKTYRHVREDITSDNYRARDCLRNSKTWARLALDSLNMGDTKAASRRLDIAQGYFATYANLCNVAVPSEDDTTDLTD